jgi:hypothetical protein
MGAAPPEKSGVADGLLNLLRGLSAVLAILGAAMALVR